MMVTSLVLALLAAGPRPYDVQHYALTVRLAPTGEHTSTVAITLKPSKNLLAVELDAYDLTVVSASVNGAPATASTRYDRASRTGTVTVRPKGSLRAGAVAVVELSYTGSAGTTHNGFFRASESDAPDAPVGFFTHFEPNFAQRFFPVNDDPSDKATSEVTVVAAPGLSVVSNGVKVSDELLVEGERRQRRVRWTQEKPHAPYLIALAIAPLEPVEVARTGIPSTVWVPPGEAARAYVAKDVIPRILEVQAAFTRTPFPWAKLDVVGVPRFFMGGMENTSVIFERTSKLLVETLNDQTAREGITGLLAHETAHQWFGDLVTCRSWPHIWLNEGFATYLGSKTMERLAEPGDDRAAVMRFRGLEDRYFRQEAGPRAHPLVDPSVSPQEAFDGVTYTKGAAVLRMLERWVGEPAMSEALGLYLKRHAYGAVTSDDFFAAVFAATGKGRELGAFKDAWLNRRGYPVITPSSTFNDGVLTVTVAQRPSTEKEKGVFVFKLPIVVHRQSEPRYSQAHVITVDRAKVTSTLNVPAPPEWIDWNEGQGALAVVEPSAVTETQWLAALRSDPDPVWRLQAAFTVIPLALAGSSEPATLALAEVLEKDPSWAVREAILERLVQRATGPLPVPLHALILAQAKSPTGSREDPPGTIRFRRAALSALGLTSLKDGHEYLVQGLSRDTQDINYLEGFALGVAHLGTSAAQATLEAALVTHTARGAPYAWRVAKALGAFPSESIVPAIRRLAMASPADNELLRPVFEQARDNVLVRRSVPYAALVRDVVLDERFGEDLRATVLGTLDEVKEEPARLALAELVEKVTSERLKGRASKALSGNFPPAPKTR